MTSHTVQKWRKLEQDQKRRNDELLRRDGPENYKSVIKSRISEVEMMTNPPPRPPLIYELVDDTSKARIEKIDNWDMEDFIRARRMKWKNRSDQFRYAAKMVTIISQTCKKWQQFISMSRDKPLTQYRRGAAATNPKSAGSEMNERCSIGWEVQSYLCIPPRQRSRKQLKKIDWILRATKAFVQLFPDEMLSESAKYVGYNRFEDGRLIAKQGRKPDWFYYVLSGKIVQFRQYKLSSGAVNRNMGNLTKGMSTDVDELVTGTLRECAMLAKGHVEVLVLHRSAFLHLQHTSDELPLDFVKKLDIFRDFPVDAILSQQDEAIRYDYYGPGKVVAKDTNRTPWLHIIKTGNVKVVRKQSVVDTKNEFKVVKQSKDDLGLFKPPSHAKAMLGVSYQQRMFKEGLKIEAELAHLPQVAPRLRTSTKSARSLVVTPNKQHRTIIHKEPSDKQKQSPESIQEEYLKRIANRNVMSQTISEQNDEENQNERVTETRSSSKSRSTASSPSKSALKSRNSSGSGSRGSAQKKSMSFDKDLNPFSTSYSPPPRKRPLIKRRETKGIEAFLPPVINVPKRDSDDETDDEHHPFFITREKTQTSMLKIGSGKRKETSYRDTIVLLDVLKSGGMFGLEDIYKCLEQEHKKEAMELGLEHLQQPMTSEEPGFSLISDGAEIIRISKRFFLQRANNNTMLKVDTLIKKYMNEREAQDTLHDDEIWNKYKSALMDKTISTIVKRNSPKHKYLKKSHKNNISSFPGREKTVFTFKTL
ncbi:uncharacterized protein LOC141906017 [Tubulanus polymorphus]|uniref:uncharacterized protein LOC141906017 n=1 Tax=Tubulanus polymorphus TaxID=672921 RepID=UPI003DA29385